MWELLRVQCSTDIGGGLCGGGDDCGGVKNGER